MNAPEMNHDVLLQEKATDDDDNGAKEVARKPKKKRGSLFRGGGGKMKFLMHHENKETASSGGVSSTEESKSTADDFKQGTTMDRDNDDAASAPPFLENVMTIPSEDDDDPLKTATPETQTKKRNVFYGIKQRFRIPKNNSNNGTTTTTRTRDSWGGFPKARSTGELKAARSFNLATRLGLERGTVSTPSVLANIQEEEEEEADEEQQNQPVPVRMCQKAEDYDVVCPSSLPGDDDHGDDADSLVSSLTYPFLPKKKVLQQRKNMILACPPVRTQPRVALLGFHITRMDLALELVGSYRCEYRSFDILFQVPPGNNNNNKYSREDGVLISTIVRKIPKLQNHENENVQDGGETNNNQDDATQQQQQQQQPVEMDTTSILNNMCKSLQLQQKLNTATSGAACLGVQKVKNDVDHEDETCIVLFYHSLAPIVPPDYEQFQRSVLKFINVALQVKTQLDPTYFWI